MRTTIDLPNNIFRQAKKVAAEEGMSLREVVVRALEAHLSKPQRKKPYKFDWRPVKGGLPIPEEVWESRTKLYEYFGWDRKL